MVFIYEIINVWFEIIFYICITKLIKKIMKKITFLFLMFVASFGYSQINPINFEAGGNGALWTWTPFENGTNIAPEMVANPSSSGINTSSTVCKYVPLVVGQPYAGFESMHGAGIGTFNLTAANAVVKIMVYKSVISPVGIKFATAAGASTGELKVSNTLVNQWEELTFNFSSKIGEASSTGIDQIVFFPDFQARTSDNICYIDNVTFGNVSSIPTSPIAAAPAPPVRNAVDVISAFSDAYTNITIGNWNPFWGQSTVVTDVNIAGNATKKYENLNYQGVEIGSNINVSQMTKLHIDVWTPNVSELKISIISQGLENPVSVMPSVAGWNSFDIPVSSYTVPDKTQIFQFKFEGIPSGGTLYYDNLYFWRPASATGTPNITGFAIPSKVVGDVPFAITAPMSDSPGTFTYTSSNLAVATISGNMITVGGVGTATITANQAASGTFLSGSTTASFMVGFAPPAAGAPMPPARQAENVISIFSDAYTNLADTNFNPGWGQTTQYAEVLVAGNPTLKYSNLNYQGNQFAAGINLVSTGMEKLHIDFWTPDATNLDVFLVAGDAGGEQAIPVAATTGGWKSADISLAGYTIPKNNIIQFKFVSLPFGGTTVYIDNLYFWKQGLNVANNDIVESKIYPNPTTGMVTIEAKNNIQNIAIFNVLGQEVVSNQPNSTMAHLNISSLQAGIYIVKTTVDGQSSTSRLIKK